MTLIGYFGSVEPDEDPTEVMSAERPKRKAKQRSLRKRRGRPSVILRRPKKKRR